MFVKSSVKCHLSPCHHHQTTCLIALIEIAQCHSIWPRFHGWKVYPPCFLVLINLVLDLKRILYFSFAPIVSMYRHRSLAPSGCSTINMPVYSQYFSDFITFFDIRSSCMRYMFNIKNAEAGWTKSKLRILMLRYAFLYDAELSPFCMTANGMTLRGCTIILCLMKIFSEYLGL